MYYTGKLGYLKNKNYENYEVRKKRLLVSFFKKTLFAKKSKKVFDKKKYLLNNPLLKLLPTKTYNKKERLQKKSFLKLFKKKTLFLKHYDFNLNYKNIIGTESTFEINNIKRKNKKGCFLSYKSLAKKKNAFINKNYFNINKKNVFNTIIRLIIFKKKNVFNYFTNTLNYYYGFLWKRNKNKALLTMNIAKIKNKKWHLKNPYCFFFYGDTDDIYIKSNISLKSKNSTIPGLLKKKEKIGNLFCKKKNYLSTRMYNRKFKIFKKGI